MNSTIILDLLTVSDYFNMFVTAQTAKGVSDATLRTYHNHFAAVSKHLDVNKPMSQLKTEDLQGMIASMRACGLAHNSISSYARMLYTNPFLHITKAEELTKHLFMRSGIHLPRSI